MCPYGHLSIPLPTIVVHVALAVAAGSRRRHGIGQDDRMPLSNAVFALPYYLPTNPTMVAIARRGIQEVLADEYPN